MAATGAKSAVSDCVSLLYVAIFHCGSVCNCRSAVRPSAFWRTLDIPCYIVSFDYFAHSNIGIASNPGNRGCGSSLRHGSIMDKSGNGNR